MQIGDYQEPHIHNNRWFVSFCPHKVIGPVYEI